MRVKARAKINWSLDILGQREDGYHLMDMLMQPMLGVSASSMLYFSTRAIARGQVWRLLTFIFIPPSSSLAMILLSLYFYWMIGSQLENQWGSFKFNLYYLFGIIGGIVSGYITGYATNHYINLSLFLAYAAMWPNHEFRLFFILPVKVKYLALLDIFSLALSFLYGGMAERVALVMALLNVLLFFGGDMLRNIRAAKRRRDFRKNFYDD